MCVDSDPVWFPFPNKTVCILHYSYTLVRETLDLCSFTIHLTCLHLIELRCADDLPSDED